MHNRLKLALIASCCAFSLPSVAEDLTIQIADPKFKVVVPGAPQVQLGPHPAASQNPSARLLGTTDGFNVSALTPKAEGASAQQCASWLAGSTISRFAPDLASVQLVPAGSNAWVLIYSMKVGQVEQLKAHVFSGDGKGHCLEIHMSRLGPTPEQRQAWFTGFRGATVGSE